jgi:hypothetical protein
MSTLAYAALTTKREESAPGTSQDKQAPGLKTYVDAFAALVPAEVLTVHALIISVTTKTNDVDKKTQIIDGANTTLLYSFWGLILLSIILYVVPRLKNGNWNRLDFLRAPIPALAFVGWTMLQRMTAFDAIDPGLKDYTRTVIALFLAVLLGLAASSLAFQADQKDSTSNQ